MTNNQTFTFNIKAVADMKDVVSNVQNIQNALKQLKLPNDLQNSFKKTFGDLERELDKYQKLMAGGFKTKNDATALEKSGNNIIRLYDEVLKKINSLDNTQLKKAFEDLGAKEVENLKQKIDELQNSLKSNITSKIGSSFTDLKKSFKDLSTGAENLDKELSKIGNSTLNTFVNNLSSGRLDLAEKNFDSLKERIKGITDQLSAEKAEPINAWIKKIGEAFANLKTDGDISPIVKQMEQLKQSLATAKADTLQKLINDFNAGKVSAEEFGQSIRQVTQADEDFARSQANVNKEIDQIKSRIQYFFGLSNAINLVKRAIRDAVNTIKELDKVMTETAVVTDFSVSDMWEQLPEYTKRANELGVTTKAAYEAATLYYQQGLKTNEVNALSVETLKMARIAGLDAAEATDRMTNALRGFNMELTEANAQRVDDVYSELAANTASNVDEISTAMTKVASLAHNANMEFETTAAFLAQIIETTRESAETAGTALKTVVARFSEVKKLMSEGQLTGTDEEGQAIDVNRVGAALRTAGIDLNKYFLGEVGLDDIFMELASKWDTLTSVQQRYIATQAAGSRQQSRFIAMMQDYARTQELVGKAYNANGASAKQFAKTQESLESKLNRLKNAWNEFLMGLTNNNIVKGFVDLLTDLLNTINKLTDAFGESGSSIAKWGVALTGIASGAALFKDGGVIDKVLGKSFLSGFLGLNKKAGVTKASLGGLTQVSTTLMSAYDSTGILDLSISFEKLNKTIKAAWSSLKLFVTTAAPLIGIAAAIAGFAALTAYNEKQYARRANPTIALKEQVDEAKKFAEEIKDLSADLDEVASKWKNIQSTQETNLNNVNNADSIKAYRESIQAQNEYVRSLIEQDAAYSQYVKTVEGLDGEIILTLDEDALAAAADKAAEAAVKASVGSIFADQNVYATNNAYLKARKEQLESQYTERDGKYYKKVGTQTDFSVLPTGQTVALAGINGQLNEIEISAESYSPILAEMQNIESQIQENNNQISAIATQGYYQLGEHAGLTGEALTLSSQTLGSLFDTDAYNKAIEDYIANTKAEDFENGILGIEGTRSEWLKKYFDMYGQEAPDNIQDADLYRKVAAGAIQADQEQQLKNLGDFVKSSDLARSLVQAFNGEVELDISSLTHADRLAEILGLDPTDFAKKLAQSQNVLLKRRRNAASQYYTSMMGAGIKPSEQTQSQINNLSLEDLNHLNSIVSNLQDTLDPTYFSQLFNNLPSLESEELTELDVFARSFNLDQPIAAFQQLENAIKNAADGTRFKDILLSIKETNKELFSASSLLQSFTLTDEYTELTETLNKFIKENGKISADNIEELAESSKNLALLLEQDEINAASLANALTLLQNGDISLESLTDRTLVFLGKIIDTDDRVKLLQQRLAKFDKGLDYGEGSEFFSNLSEELNELINGYEFGNERLIKLYDEFAGEGSYQALIDKYWHDDPEAFAKIIQSRVDAMRDAIENNSYGFMDTFAGNKNLGISRINGSKYDFQWDTQGRTYDEMIKAIQDEWKAKNGYTIGEDYAEAILQGFMAQAPKFKAEIEQNNYNDALKTLSESALETGYITTQELEAMAQASHKTIEEIRADLAASNLELPIEISWQGDSGPLTGKALEAEWNELSDAVSFEMPMLEGEENVIDYQKALAQLQEYGMSAAQAIEILNKKVADSNGKLSLGQQIITGFDDAGEAIPDTITAPTAEALEDGVKKGLAEQNFQQEADILSASIGTAVADALKSALLDPGEDGSTLASTVGTHMATALVSAWDQFVAHANANQPSTTAPIIGGRPARATGGIVQSFANGSSNNSFPPGFALTGEEGPEIIWNKDAGYAYITGKNGAEFQNLQPGDRVFNAAETSRILRNSFAKGGIFESYAGGGYNPKVVNKKDDGGGGGSSSGSSSKDKAKEEKWKNEVDWLYNLVEDIAELERIQTQLEEQYEDYLADEAKTGQDLYKLLIQQLGNLYTQLDHQTFALEKREQEMREFMDTTNKYDDYLWYNWDDRTLEIDWDRIEALKANQKETYDEIVDLISEAEDIQGKMDDAEDSIQDIRNQIEELENIWRDTYVDFEERVYAAIVKSYQATIDSYSQLNETLNNSNAAILDALQKQIALERQIRDNTKTEEDIANNEAQLAYLRRDTSGANEMAALELQQQLSDQRQDYEDTLIDQAISRLQEDNDAAAQQREHQIEIMQAQLDYQEQSGEFNLMVLELLQNAMGADGELLTNSDLVDLLKSVDNWSAMSEVSKKVWEEELNTNFKEVVAFLLKQNAEENGTFTTALTGAIEAVNATIGSYSQGVLKSLNESSKSSKSGGGSSGGSSGSSGKSSSSKKNTTKTVEWVQAVDPGDTSSDKNAATVIKKKPKKPSGGVSNNSRGTVNYLVPYATGGLNTQTGLAWLDGTPSEPEYVLNARQTDAFLKLAEVLPTMMNSNANNTQTNNTSNISLNIEMNVDKIDSDYDVDQIADRVKDIIYNIGQYRNVNTLNFSR